MEKIVCTELIKKLKTFEDRQNFCRELGNKLLIIFRIYFTQREGFCYVFFFTIFKAGKKGK
jgi:hypothetical protein